MFVSLRAKISLLFLLGLLLILSLTALVVTREVKTRYQALFIESGSHIAEQLAAKTEKLFALGLQPFEFVGYEKLCQDTVNGSDSIIFAALLDDHGIPMLKAGEWDRHLADTPFSELKAAINETNDFYITVPVDNPLKAEYSILVIVNSELVEQQVYSLLGAVLLYTTLAAFLCIAILFIFLRRNFLMPIKSLVKYIEAVNPEEVSVPDWLLPKRSDELGVVARAFDGLIKTLSASNKKLFDTNTELKSLAGSLEQRVNERTLALKEANSRLETMAHTDVLTGLNNRLTFSEVLYERFASARHYRHTFAVIVVDLDGFKIVNDDYGHAAGDYALKLIGERIRTSFRKNDTCFRLGGDEFVFLFQNYENYANIFSVILKIQQLILQPIIMDGAKLPLGVSIGVAYLDFNNDFTVGADDLLDMADQAMYDAKREKSDFVIVF